MDLRAAYDKKVTITELARSFFGVPAAMAAETVFEVIIENNATGKTPITELNGRPALSSNIKSEYDFTTDFIGFQAVTTKAGAVDLINQLKSGGSAWFSAGFKFKEGAPISGMTTMAFKVTKDGEPAKNAVLYGLDLQCKEAEFLYPTIVFRETWVSNEHGFLHPVTSNIDRVDAVLISGLKSRLTTAGYTGFWGSGNGRDHGSSPNDVKGDWMFDFYFFAEDPSDYVIEIAVVPVSGEIAKKTVTVKVAGGKVVESKLPLRTPPNVKVMNVFETTVVHIQETEAEEYAKDAFGSGFKVNEFFSLGSFKAKPKEGDTWGADDVQAMSREVKGSDFLANRVSGVRVVKIRPDLESLSFEYTTDVNVKDGQFAIQYEEFGDYLPQSHVFNKEHVYRINLFIKDGGDFDLDKTKDLIDDPAMLVNGGGGCSASFAPLLGILALAGIAAIGRKRV